MSVKIALTVSSLRRLFQKHRSHSFSDSDSSESRESVLASTTATTNSPETSVKNPSAEQERVRSPAEQLRIDAIIGQRVRDGTVEYLVKWHVPSSHDLKLMRNPSWMPIDTVSYLSPRAIRQFVCATRHRRETRTRAARHMDLTSFGGSACRSSTDMRSDNDASTMICASCSQGHETTEDYFSRRMSCLSLVPESPRASTESVSSIRAPSANQSLETFHHGNRRQAISQVPDIYVDLATQFFNRRVTESRSDPSSANRRDRPSDRPKDGPRCGPRSYPRTLSSFPTLRRTKVRSVVSRDSSNNGNEKTAVRLNRVLKTPITLVDQRFTLPPRAPPNVPLKKDRIDGTSRDAMVRQIVSPATNHKIQLITRNPADTAPQLNVSLLPSLLFEDELSCLEGHSRPIYTPSATDNMGSVVPSTQKVATGQPEMEASYPSNQSPWSDYSSESRQSETEVSVRRPPESHDEHCSEHLSSRHARVEAARKTQQTTEAIKEKRASLYDESGQRQNGFWRFGTLRRSLSKTSRAAATIV